MAGDENNHRRSLQVQQCIGCLDAREIRHLNIQEKHVGPQLFSALQAIGSVFGFTDDLYALTFQQSP
jgi:hypothetical protein